MTNLCKMGTPHKYYPLSGDEIRLLKVEPSEEVVDTTNTAKRRPIVCSLEHVCLPHVSKDQPNQQFKGRGRIWPEISSKYDLTTLFKKGRDVRAGERDQTMLSGETVQDETHLPWRHEWGDFIALSYVWSYPRRPEGEPPHTIIVDGSTFEVTPNLYYALAHLSKSFRIRQGFKLWVDAICINQNDTAERGQQVARMRDIYQSAWQVAIWLGPESDDSQLAFLALHWLARESKRTNPLEGFYHESFSIDLRPLLVMWPTYQSPMRKEVYKALFHFFTRPYWRRMWVVQEIAMGNPNTPVICGDACISWKDLYDAVTLIGEDESRFGREIIGSVRPQILSQWSFEVARDRVVQGRDWAPGRMWEVQSTIMSLQNHQEKPTSKSDPGILVQALNLVRDCRVTEELDRVYGILGIKAITDNLVWNKTPSYTITLSQLYVEFSSGFLAAGNLSILRLVSRCAGPSHTGDKTMSDLPPMLRQKHTAPLSLWAVNRFTASPTSGTLCTHDVPSWTVCWTCAPAPTAHLRGFYRADAGLGQPGPVYPTSKRMLQVQGVPIDTIVSLSSSHGTEADKRYPLNLDVSQKSAYGSLEATRQAFWRTIVGDTTEAGGERAPECYSWLLRDALWLTGVAGIYTYDFALHLFMGRNQNLRVCGYTLRELLIGRGKLMTKLKRAAGDRLYDITEEQRSAYSWAVNAMAWRRLFGTKEGRMGMGTCAAEVGDRIVILRGCNTPLLLRECNGGWALVGECYVHGVMYGEVTAETHELVDITIY